MTIIVEYNFMECSSDQSMQECKFVQLISFVLVTHLIRQHVKTNICIIQGG